MFAQAFSSFARRGVFFESTPNLALQVCAALSSPRCAGAPPLSVYAGFDPTAPSLHLGHVGVLMALLRLQRSGLRPIALIGGATALIGDPTGRSADRPQLGLETVADNAAQLRAQLAALLGEACLVVDNARYYEGMSVINFMRDVGVHFRLSQLLARDSVRGRMGWSGTVAAAAGAEPPQPPNTAPAPSGGMSYTEFSYSIFQAYDFWVLHKNHGAVLQVGGSDQWGNITAGVELIRRLQQQQQRARDAPPLVQAHGAVVPLLTNSAGKKFGKSDGASGPLWLNPSLTSHHALWQHLLGVEDGDALPLLRSLTLVKEEELEALSKATLHEPHKKAAQLRLADEVVGWVRGKEAVREARHTAKLLHPGSAIWGGEERGGGAGSGANSSDAVPSDASGGGDGPFAAQRAALASLRYADLEAMGRANGVSSARWEASRVRSGGASVLDALLALGMVKSKAEGRRLVEGGGVYWNWGRVLEPLKPLAASDFVEARGAVVNVGRKRSGIVTLVCDDAKEM
jgi:tyrosyl-tRNA synthetase